MSSLPVTALRAGGVDRGAGDNLARYGPVDLLCIEELGYMELDWRGAELLFQVLTAREEKASVAIASNEGFSGLTRLSPIHGCAPPSWIDFRSAATSSEPAPIPTA
jgi:DNA replication protein DnaC